MRVSWVYAAAVVLLVAASVHAAPAEEEYSSGSKTVDAIKQFFSPVTNYFSSLPSKTPSDIATDVKETVTDVKVWAKENEAIQALRGALTPLKDWIQDKATDLKDQTFSDMYENVKTSVKNMDDRIGTWLQESTSE